MSSLRWLIFWLGQPSALKLLLGVNLFGTIYGFYWYRDQLLSTEWYLLPFVPDSPTASLFFTLFLLAMLLNKKWLYIESFAAVTLFKYGIWATVMIVWTGFLGGDLTWQHYMLITSHLGMAIQSLLYIPYFSFGKRHLLVIALWTLTNDYLDYTLHIFPWLSVRLHPYLPVIATLTILLSILSLYIFYRLVVRKQV